MMVQELIIAGVTTFLPQVILHHCHRVINSYLQQEGCFY